jgi:MFS family permease
LYIGEIAVTLNCNSLVLKSQHKTLSIITLILAGEAIFLLPFILMRVFRPIIREALVITDLEIGKAQAFYGITAMVSYVFGGFLADKWEPRKLISISLIFTSLGGVYMIQIPSFQGLQILYGFWGVSTILLFWAALIKATRLWGNADNQGLSFGLLDGGRGAFAALIATFGALIPSLIFPEDSTTVTLEDKTKTLQYIIGFKTSVVLMVAFLVWKVLPDADIKPSNAKESSFRLQYSEILNIVVKPKVFFHAVIIVCAYSTYKVTDVYATYAKDVWDYSIEEASKFGVIIQWIRPFAAISIGWLADKFVTSKAVLICFVLILLGYVLLGFGAFENVSILFSVLTFFLMAIGIYAMRGLYFALIEEAKTPLLITGTVIGIISFLGYTPDIFMSLISGYMLGESPTLEDYQALFKVVMFFPLIGVFSTLVFRSLVKD